MLYLSRTQTSIETNNRISKYNIQSKLLHKYIISVNIRKEGIDTQYYNVFYDLKSF